MEAVMGWLHVSGVTCIQWLQASFKDYTELMLVFSDLGDPRNAFLIYFPLAYFCSTAVGVKVIWVGALAEWLNAVLKWLLHGERPYWWVRATDLYDTPPQIQQFRLTCETGPGSPSGHVMVTSAVLWVLVTALMKNRVHNRCARLLLVAVFLLFMTAVGMSRCYIATHFPHQVVFGIIVGVLVAEACDRLPLLDLSLPHNLLVSLSLLVSGPLIYWGVSAQGWDPVWSVSLAQRWCARPEWVYLDTTLFFALVRDASVIAGLGCGLAVCKQLHLDTDSLPGSYRVMGLTVAWIFARVVESFTLPHDSEWLFYSLGFLRNLFIPFTILTVLSWALTSVMTLISSRCPKKNS